MKTTLDCIPCFIRQALDAARLVTSNSAHHERIMHEILVAVAEMDLAQTPPVIGQLIHRKLRELAGEDDPYREIKKRHNAIAMELLSTFKHQVAAADDPLLISARLAIAGNAIDMGANGNLSEANVRGSLSQALTEPFFGEVDSFRQAITKAQSILYLGDNAGEIAFDRQLIEQLPFDRITFVVRGAPIINDALMADAQAVGLGNIVEVIENGSDVPGTILSDCNQEFQRRFAKADLIIAKGQGNFESLYETPGNIFFLFKVKCPIVGGLVHQPIGMQMLLHATSGTGEKV